MGLVSVSLHTTIHMQLGALYHGFGAVSSCGLASSEDAFDVEEDEARLSSLSAAKDSVCSRRSSFQANL